MLEMRVKRREMELIKEILGEMMESFAQTRCFGQQISMRS